MRPATTRSPRPPSPTRSIRLAPSSSVTFPVNGSSYNGTTYTGTISGTASDNLDGRERGRQRQAQQRRPLLERHEFQLGERGLQCRQRHDLVDLCPSCCEPHRRGRLHGPLAGDGYRDQRRDPRQRDHLHLRHHRAEPRDYYPADGSFQARSRRCRAPARMQPPASAVSASRCASTATPTVIGMAALLGHCQRARSSRPPTMVSPSRSGPRTSQRSIRRRTELRRHRDRDGRRREHVDGQQPFTFDTTLPTASITFPTNGGVYNAAGWDNGCSTPGTGDICGTAADSGSGVQTVMVSINPNTDNKYWDGGDFTGNAEQFFSATGTTKLQATSCSTPAR